MTSATFETLRVEADGPIGRLTLARPERLNALSVQALRELADAARWFDGEAGVKVVVVAGEGRAFSAGFDLDDFSGVGSGGRDSGDAGRRMADAVTDMRALTIAAVQGHCVGGGVVLAAACDLRIASDDATFSIPEVDLGIPLAWGGIPRLVRELGPAVTKELVLTCRPFSAGEARALRFVNRVVPGDSLMAEVGALASQLAAKSALTLDVTKRHVNAVTEEMGSTRMAFNDTDALQTALHDPESRAVAAGYLEQRQRRRQSDA
ncbi:MAG: enoyl-CoA hydratase/isomerase family protein [Actinomycetota bacterium]